MMLFFMDWTLEGANAMGAEISQIKGFPFVSCELVLFFVAAFKGKDMNRGPYQ